MRLDYYDILPDGMEAYLSHYGWHFSRKMCEWAVGGMRDMSDNEVKMKSKEQVDAIIKKYNINIKNNYGYDVVYVYHMCISDFVGSSIIDEAHAAAYVRDLLDDRDGYNGIAFTRFFADCSAKGVPILWNEMI